ncbi:MAG TPA: hypothetical protein PKN09_14420, partial [Novosphingobium sp.]|nr:hypothetical protein [Novosphingobium sp.]
VLLTLALGKALGNTAPALAMGLVDCAMFVVVLRFANHNWGPVSRWSSVLAELVAEGRAALGQAVGGKRRG